MPTPAPTSDALRGYEVVVCVCGGIAAYKVAGLVSALVQRGCDVQVAMTRNARRFVGPLTFAALSGRPVLTSMWHGRDAAGALHLRCTQTADLIVVAPATANILAKLAAGIADDLVSTLLLAAGCPVLLAPAMNVQMWQNPTTQHNVALLRQRGYALIGPETGWQACGVVGAGRMSDPETILAEIENRLRQQPPRAGA